MSAGFEGSCIGFAPGSGIDGIPAGGLLAVGGLAIDGVFDAGV
jgi:hypothetical protein